MKCLTKTGLVPWCRLEAPVKVIILLPLFSFSFLFYLQLPDCCSYRQFLHLLPLAGSFLLMPSVMSFNLEDFIAHPSKEELDSLLKPQLRQVVQRLKIEHEENAKKAELKRLILDYLVEGDLTPDDELDSASSEVEIRRLELEHNAREQEKQRECQLKLKELELREKEIAAKKELDLKGS